MRATLRRVLDELERRGRPLFLGAGLALAGGPEGCAALHPAADATASDGAARDAGADRDLSIAVAMYSAPGCSAAPRSR
jgi:hypothetical protein